MLISGIDTIQTQGPLQSPGTLTDMAQSTSAKLADKKTKTVSAK